jgi:hypothetical protein
MLTEIRALIPQPIKDFLKRIIYAYRWDSWQRSSWSQEGEDLILARIFGDKPDGFYARLWQAQSRQSGGGAV